MSKKNDIIALTIDGFTSEGNGVGRQEGMAVFVPDTAVGDQIEARLVKLHPRYAYGRLEKLVSPSADRIEQDCPVGRRCGGCSLRHISYAAEKRIKHQQVQDAFSRLGGFDITCGPLLDCGKTEGYRNKALFPVQEKGGKIQMGFYAKRSHDVVEHIHCLLQPPAFGVIAGAVRRYIAENGVTCYDENTGRGLVRHLYLRRADSTGQLMVCLVINGDCIPHHDRLLQALEALHLPIRCVALNQNRENTNVVMGKKTTILWGEAFIEDVLCGVRVRLSPESFYQVNHDAAEVLYREAARCAGLTGEETLLDLYCGAGTIGLSMAHDVRRLIGVEVMPSAVEDARINAQANGIENAQFLCGDAGSAAAALAAQGVRPDVILVDPPRKGCGEDVLAAIRQMHPQRVVMISCNPSTAARDCKRLCEMGYAIQEITPVDLFPRTMHCEICVTLCIC